MWGWSQVGMACKVTVLSPGRRRRGLTRSEARRVEAGNGCRVKVYLA